MKKPTKPPIDTTINSVIVCAAVSYGLLQLFLQSVETILYMVRLNIMKDSVKMFLQ